MLKLNTNLFGDEVPVNGTAVTSPLIPAPIKSLPGQASLFSAGNFFDDDAEPIVIETKPAEVAAETVMITAPFVDDTPPFDVPAELSEIVQKALIGVEHPIQQAYRNGLITVEEAAKAIGIPDDQARRMAEANKSHPLPPIVSESLPAPVAMPIAPTVEERGTDASMIVEVSLAEAEYLYGEKLQSLETELADLDLDVLAAKDELKRVSRLQQSAAKILRGFKARGVEGFHADLIEERQEAADEAAEAAAEAEQAENPKPSRDALSKDTAEEKRPFVPMVVNIGAPTQSDYWQNVSVRELKINPKIITRLIESGIDTLEKLEWRRKGVHDGAEKWPTGIGEKKVTEIEDGVVKWFSEHQTDRVATELPANPVAAENDTAEPEPAAKKTRKPRKKKEQESAEINQDDEDDDTTADNFGPGPTKEEHESQILEEVEAIKSRGEANYSEPPADAELCRKWDTGYEYCQSGGPVTDCILEGGSQRTSWLKGWLTADSQMKK